MGMKSYEAHGLRLFFSMLVVAVFFIITFINGDSSVSEIGWLILEGVIIFAVWTGLTGLRKRFGKLCFVIIPAAYLLYYGMGVLIINVMEGWDALGLALMFIFLGAGLVAAFLLFLIELFIVLYLNKR